MATALEHDTNDIASKEQSDSVRSAVLKASETFRTKGYEEAIDDAFDELDIKRDGQLDRSELQGFLQEAARTVRLEVETEVIEAAVDALIHDAGGGDEDFISRTRFHDVFQRHPDMLTVFKDEETVSSLRESIRSRDLSIQEIQEDEEENKQVWAHAQAEWKNRRVAFVWLVLYAAANVTAFTYKGVKYARDDEATAVFGDCIVVARGAAQTLNLNACIILIPMCRHFLTLLRKTSLRFLFPFDAQQEFHVWVGIVIALFSTAHFAAHMCDFTRFAAADEEDLYALFGNKLGVIPESSSERWKLLLGTRAGVTGIIMVVCMLVAYSTVFTRGKRFNLFWYTHHLLLVMLIALCIHGTDSLLEPFQSIYWIIGPLSLYALPRILRETPLSSLKVIEMKIKKGHVVALKLEKPSYYKGYVQAGMYGFLNIPCISRFEWHPFTLTSAPVDDFIEFHFRRVGDWTTKTHDYFEEITDESEDTGIKDPPIIKVEGPIGASSQGFSDYPILVLIGAGIGITPMISVLKMLLANPGRMRRTFFYWTTRDRESFTWFTSLMDDIFESDQKNVLQIRHFLTSVKDDDRDLGAVLLHHATRAHHKRTDVDLLLGNRTHHQVEVGRPIWEEELESVQEEAKLLGLSDCGIFLCGPKKMAEAVQEASSNVSRQDGSFHMYFTKETF